MLTKILMGSDDEATNPTLSGGHIDLLAQRGWQRTLADGETLYCPGDRHEHFFVVLGGKVLIVDGDGAAACIVAEQGPGKFLGEYGLLVGGRGLMTNVASGTTRLLCVPVTRLLDVVASDAVLSETILRALLLRRAILVGEGLGVKILGDPAEPYTRELAEALARWRVPYSLIDAADAHDSTGSVLRQFAVSPQDLPLVALGQRVLRRASRSRRGRLRRFRRTRDRHR